MIKIEAAVRLHAAEADTEKARAYIRSVAGVEPSKKVVYTTEGLIAFSIKKAGFETALSNLTKRLGKPKFVANKAPHSSNTYTWGLDIHRKVILRQTWNNGKEWIFILMTDSNR